MWRKRAGDEIYINFNLDYRTFVKVLYLCHGGSDVDMIWFIIFVEHDALMGGSDVDIIWLLICALMDFIFAFIISARCLIANLVFAFNLLFDIYSEKWLNLYRIDSSSFIKS